MSDNASIITNACAAIDRFRAELAATELELAELQVRRQCLAEFIEALTDKPRTRRPRTNKTTDTDTEDASQDAPLGAGITGKTILESIA